MGSTRLSVGVEKRRLDDKGIQVKTYPVSMPRDASKKWLLKKMPYGMAIYGVTLGRSAPDGWGIIYTGYMVNDSYYLVKK